MKVLALDTSTSRVTVAIVDGDTVIREITAGELQGAQFHSELLAGLIQECLQGLIPDAVAVGRGPGPYTGLRVGLITAQTLAFAWSIPVIGTPTLEALAHGYRRRGGGECIAVLDVKRKEIACQHFDAQGIAISEPTLVLAADLQAHASAGFVGPAFITQQNVSVQAVDSTPVSAVDIALLAQSLPKEKTSISPLYLRHPDVGTPSPAKSVLNG